MSNTAFVVFSEIPENIRLFMTDDSEAIEVLKRCHGKYVNCDESDDLDTLCRWVYGDDYTSGPDKGPLTEVSWDIPQNISSGVLLIQTGFVL